MYNGGLALCLLHAALVGFLYHETLGWDGPLTDVVNFVCLALFLSWPCWLVALVVFWYCGDRKLWRLLIPIGLGVAFLSGIALFIVAIFQVFSNYGHGC